MGNITSITVQKKNKNRSNVFVDGNFAIGLENITVVMHRLKVGMDIDIQDLAALQLASESATAFDRAIGYISVRIRTIDEIRRYLAARDYLEVTIDHVVAKLIDYKYLDDENFVKSYISTYRQRAGKNKLRQSLNRLGADEEIVDAHIEELGGQLDEAMNLATKYARVRASDPKLREKLGRHLYGRGFEWETIIAVSRQIMIDLAVDDGNGEY